MCGLFGVVGAILPGDNAFARALDTISHRGPDACAVTRTANVVLGHQRLTIIDLSDASNQPYKGAHSTLAYNGEVYNFRELRSALNEKGVTFGTTGDTEVVSKAYETWGVAAFSRLQGMYALAIHDHRTGEVHLARDPFGIKPLYYRRRGDGYAFASEIKPLLALDGAGVSEDAFLDICVWGFPISYQSFFEGIHQLPAGSVGTIAGGEMTIAGDLRSNFYGAIPAPDLRDVLVEAVRHHMISDAPVAVALSGGLDSSIVAALAGAATEAFTTTFTDSDDWEVEHAKAVARRSGFPHRVLKIEVGDFEGLLADVMRHLEEPLTNPNVFPSFCFSRALRDEGYKVVLMGEGADELFGGYPWHIATEDLAADPAPLYDYYRRRRGQAQYRNYLTSDALGRMAARDKASLLAFGQEVRGSKLSTMLSWDQAWQLQFSQLSRVDRMMMAHSVEARVPFLYAPVALAANALPDDQKVKKGAARDNKIALAAAAGELLPESVVMRPKFGVGGTVNLWETPLFADLMPVMERIRTSSDYRDARDVLSPWVDWSKVDASVGVKQALNFAMLVMSVQLHVLGKDAPRSDFAVRSRVSE